MAFFPPVLWMMLRKPDLTMAGSVALYVAARAFDWNLRSFPDGNWYFNPFCWQLLFVFGAWLALGGIVKMPLDSQVHAPCSISGSPTSLCVRDDDGGALPGFRKHVAGMAVRRLQPQRQGKSRPVSRRCILIVAAFVVTRFVSKDWPGLEWKILQAADRMRRAIDCGILPRRLPLVCRSFRADVEFGFPAGADSGQRERHRHHDPRRLLPLMVQAAGRPVGNPASHGIDRRAFRKFRDLKLASGPDLADPAQGQTRHRAPHFRKPGTSPVSRRFAASNDRETGKIRKCAAIMIVFRQNSKCGLSYQACLIPRIVRPSDMPVCGDRQSVIFF